MSTLNSNLTSKAHSLSSDVKEKTSSALEDGKDLVRKSKDTNGDLMALFTEKKDLAVTWAKDNPLTAAAIGVGVGFVLGGVVRRIMNRRS